MFAVPRENCARIHASSGTTGKPTVVGYTLKDIDTWSTVVARSIRAGGARPGDMVHISYGYGLFTGGMGAHYGAEKLGLTVVPFGGGQTERQVQLIQDFKSNIIMVTPSWPSPTSTSAKASTPKAVRCASVSLAPSLGPTTCARRSKSA
jgi:phenylacetate-CoA ligase